MQRVKKYRKAIFWILAALVVAALIWASTRPIPIDVDTAPVARGPLVVTVNEDGMTRIKERYVVSSPLGGRLSRVDLKAGDPVVAGETIIALVEPTDPQLLDARSRTQAEALVRAAKAGVERAAAELERAESAHRYAETELKRKQQLFADRLISEAEMEEAEFRANAAAAEWKSAQKGMQIADFELDQARAALLHAAPSESEGNGEEVRFPVTAPIDGRVLRVVQESSVVLTPGTPLVELGDPTDLEVIVDVLSTDAVKIRPGAEVIFEHWGGDEPLLGRVRLVEPAAFTKFSALGVEEQRVWVVIDFTVPLELRQTLGDGYRVEARIVIWQADDVIQVPTGALFRQGEIWAVFVEEDGLADLRVVERGQSNGLQTQILEGLQMNETVILHPSERVEDGALVVRRK